MYTITFHWLGAATQSIRKKVYYNLMQWFNILGSIRGKQSNEPPLWGPCFISGLSMIVRVNKVLNRTVVDSD